MLFVPSGVSVKADAAALVAAALSEFGRLDGAFNNAGSVNASGMGLVALPGVAPYVAAKHAVVGPTRATALEVAEQGVTCQRRHHPVSRARARARRWRSPPERCAAGASSGTGRAAAASAARSSSSVACGRASRSGPVRCRAS
ncbi:SDR family NAD(P)-dependent oxidoreductase [Streptomyces sp. NPDC057545]|uniref:SDR family NAD(P)-dependent oxidoreductase n=1 Tax=Streptomyces sp. NPDC057545 TaxID=3346164 RepID=UPI0036AA53A9